MTKSTPQLLEIRVQSSSFVGLRTTCGDAPEGSDDDTFLLVIVLCDGQAHAFPIFQNFDTCSWPATLSLADATLLLAAQTTRTIDR